MPKVFDQFGVTSESDLDAKLANEQEQGCSSHEGPVGFKGGVAESGGSAIAGAVCRAVSSIAETIDDAADMHGIQQFSLVDAKRLREDDAVKGLFLAHRTTIFTPHHFEYDYRLEELHDGGNYEITQWDISYDFVRELYRYRTLVERFRTSLAPSIGQDRTQDN